MQSIQAKTGASIWYEKKGYSARSYDVIATDPELGELRAYPGNLKLWFG